jgi:hypothetical protein
MPITLNASTSSGLVQTADTSGIIELQASGSTKLTVNSSGIVINTLNTSTGVLATQNGMTGIAKAWVNWNGSTGAIVGSFNVGSITKNGTGDYTVNYTTAMPNNTYASSGMSAGVLLINGSTPQSTTVIRFINYNLAGSAIDSTSISATIFSS